MSREKVRGATDAAATADHVSVPYLTLPYLLSGDNLYTDDLVSQKPATKMRTGREMLVRNLTGNRSVIGPAECPDLDQRHGHYSMSCVKKMPTMSDDTGQALQIEAARSVVL